MNKHLEKVINEYQYSKLIFENELLEETKMISKYLENLYYYSDHTSIIYKEEYIIKKLPGFAKYRNGLFSWNIIFV
jgi:hypothetical protein